MKRIFVLSPARTTGKRGRYLLGGRGASSLAQRLHRGLPVSLGEAFAFLSGLYFRGKLVYARAFTRPPAGVSGCWVVTSNLGLMPADAAISLAQLLSFAQVPIEPDEPRYRQPLDRSARRLLEQLPAACEVVFLGSVSTRRYTTPLQALLGGRLLFPLEFVGRGDMSRGGLMLRCAADGQELQYGPIPPGVLRGTRPPRLASRSPADRVEAPPPSHLQAREWSSAAPASAAARRTDEQACR